MKALLGVASKRWILVWAAGLAMALPIACLFAWPGLSQQLTPVNPKKIYGPPKPAVKAPTGKPETPQTDNSQAPVQWLDGSVDASSGQNQGQTPTGKAQPAQVAPTRAQPPRTREELEDYLHKMRRIISGITASMTSVVFDGGIGGTGTTDPARLGTAGTQFAQLGAEARMTTPPEELKAVHDAVCGACTNMYNVCRNNEAGQKPSLMSAMTLMMGTLSTFQNYSTSCLQFINAHNLDTGLNPCGGDVGGNLQQLMSGLGNMGGGGGSAGNSGGGWLSGDSGSAGSGGGLGGMGGGLGGMMGGLGSMMGGGNAGDSSSGAGDSSSSGDGGGGGLGGMDMNALQKMLGQ